VFSAVRRNATLKLAQDIELFEDLPPGWVSIGPIWDLALAVVLSNQLTE